MGREKFQQYYCCEGCGRLLPQSYTKEYCPACEEMQLFSEVRDYVRIYDVNEYDVAEHFGIPIRVVRQWIKDGRIEYKENQEKSIGTACCSRCGARVNFGTLCPKCLRLVNAESHSKGFATERIRSDGKMRFIERDNGIDRGKK